MISNSENIFKTQNTLNRKDVCTFPKIRGFTICDDSEFVLHKELQARDSELYLYLDDSVHLYPISVLFCFDYTFNGCKFARFLEFGCGDLITKPCWRSLN